MSSQRRAARDAPSEILNVGMPDSLRTHALLAAAERVGIALRVVCWRDVVAGRSLHGCVPPGGIVRIDAPDIDIELVALASGATRATVEAQARDDPGILFGCQRNQGFRAALARLANDLRDVPTASPPEEIVVLCDKGQSQPRFERHGCPVAESIPAESYPELREVMSSQAAERVFVKLRYTAAAAGIAACHAGRRGFRLLTTMVPDGKSFYSSRRVREYSDEEEIAAILSWLFAQGARVERWHEKDTLAGREFDLRVVVIAGRARHAVGRLVNGPHPFSNLHLGNERASAEVVASHWGADRWQQVISLSEDAAACFPRCHCIGVDVMWTRDRGPLLIEANAFGDLLHGVTWRGMDTYETQLRALIGDVL